MSKCIALTFLALSPLAFAAPPAQPFQAEYSVLRNGNEVGEARMRLSQEGQMQWRLNTLLHASAAAGLLQFSSVEDSHFHWHDGKLRSDRYQARRQQPLRTRERSIDFDWDAGRVLLTDQRGQEERFELDGPAIDPQLTLVAAMAAAAAGESEFEYMMVNRGAPELQRGRHGGKHTVATDLGDIVCVEIERIREHSRRETRSCHAESLDWMPVRVIQEEDGDVLELRLKVVIR